MPGSVAFPRSARITRPAEYGLAFAHGVRLSSLRLSLRVRLRAESDDGARLGMAISKRNARAAVLRNRIKRLLRDRFRHLRAELPAIDLVVQLRAPITREKTLGLADEFAELLGRACARLPARPAVADGSVPSPATSSKDAH